MFQPEPRARRADLLELPTELDRARARLDRAILDRWCANDVDDEVRDALCYQFETGGKRVRPLLALLSGRGFGLRDEQILPFALALEAMHNACLIRDDIEDEDAVRRGRPALWVRIGSGPALNLADYLIMDAFALVAECDVPAERTVALHKEFASALRATAVGQAADLDARGDVAFSRSEWERVADLKTARLFSVSLAAPAILAGLPESRVSALRAMGRDLGVAFQLRDDLVDLTWEKGRDLPANDVREGKPSYLIAWLHESGRLSPRERARLVRVLESARDATSETDVFWVQNLLHERGAITAARMRQRALCAAVSDGLDRFPGLPLRVRWCIESWLERLSV